jgi:hypothetical protein
VGCSDPGRDGETVGILRAGCAPTVTELALCWVSLTAQPSPWSRPHCARRAAAVPVPGAVMGTLIDQMSQRSRISGSTPARRRQKWARARVRPGGCGGRRLLATGLGGGTLLTVSAPEYLEMFGQMLARGHADCASPMGT